MTCQKKKSQEQIFFWLFLDISMFHSETVSYSKFYAFKKKKLKSPTYLPMSKLVFGANFSSLHFLNLQDWYNRFMGKKCFLINHVCNLHLIKFVCTKGPTIYLLGGKVQCIFPWARKKIHTKQNIIFIFTWKTSNFSSSSCWVRLFFIFFFYIFQF